MAKKCKIVFSLGENSDGQKLEYVIEDALDNTTVKLSENPLLDIAEFLQKNNKLDELLEHIQNFYSRELDDYNPRVPPGTPNMTLEQITKTFDVEGGWPANIEKLKTYKKYNILYKNTRSKLLSGIRTYNDGTIVVYNNGIYDLKRFIETNLILNSNLPEHLFSDEFNKIYNAIKEKYNLTSEKDLINDFLHNQTYLYGLEINVDNKTDPLIVIEQEISKILGTKKTKYKTLFLSSLANRLLEDSKGKYIPKSKLEELAKAYNTEVTDIIKYLKSQIELDPEFPYKFRGSLTVDGENGDKLELIYFNKISRTTVDSIYKLGSNETYPDKFLFVKIYKGNRIYKVEDKIGVRYYYSKELVTKRTKMSEPFDTIDELIEEIDKFSLRENVKDGMVRSYNWTGEELVTSKNVKYNLGTIIRVLEGSVEYPHSSYWKKRYMYGNISLTVQDLIDELTEIKNELIRRSNNRETISDKELLLRLTGQDSGKLLGEYRNNINKIQGEISELLKLTEIDESKFNRRRLITKGLITTTNNKIELDLKKLDELNKEIEKLLEQLLNNPENTNIKNKLSEKITSREKIQESLSEKTEKKNKLEDSYNESYNDYLTRIKKEISDLKTQLDSIYKLKLELEAQEVEKLNLNELESCKMYTLRLRESILNGDVDDIKYFFEVLSNKYKIDTVRKTGFNTILDRLERKLKELEGELTREERIGKEDDLQSIKRLITSFINEQFGVNYFFDYNKIDNLISQITDLDKALAAILEISTLKDSLNPDEELDKIILKLSLMTEYSYYQVVLDLREQTYLLAKVNKPSSYTESEFPKQYTSRLDQINEIVKGLNYKLEGTGYEIIVLSPSQIREECRKNGRTALGQIRSGLRAFISDNKIVINSALADLTTPLHEYAHLFLGIIKAQNPDQYHELIEQLAKKYPRFESKLQIKMNWMRNHTAIYRYMSYYDLLEEAFADVYAEMMAPNIRETSSSDFSFEMDGLKVLTYKLSDIFDLVKKGEVLIEKIFQYPLFSIKDLVSGVKNESMSEEEYSKQRLKKIEEIFSSLRKRREITNFIQRLIGDKVIIENCV